MAATTASSTTVSTAASISRLSAAEAESSLGGISYNLSDIVSGWVDALGLPRSEVREVRANLVEAAARSAVDQEMLLLTDDPTPDSTELEETGEG